LLLWAATPLLRTSHTCLCGVASGPAWTRTSQLCWSNGHLPCVTRATEYKDEILLQTPMSELTHISCSHCLWTDRSVQAHPYLPYIFRCLCFPLGNMTNFAGIILLCSFQILQLKLICQPGFIVTCNNELALESCFSK